MSDCRTGRDRPATPELLDRPGCGASAVGRAGPPPQQGGAPEPQAAPLAGPEPAFDLIELLFFSYRDFVGDADRRLAADGFGRAHHRVLYFVSRNPGMTVNGLLELLRITKQSLNRVLKELIDRGHITQKEGEADRRQRLLYVTDTGAALVHELAVLQSRRINRALAQCAPGARAHVADFLGALTDQRLPDRRGGQLRGKG